MFVYVCFWSRESRVWKRPESRRGNDDTSRIDSQVTNTGAKKRLWPDLFFVFLCLCLFLTMTTPTKEEQFINQGGGVVVTSVLLWQYFILLFLINIAPVPAHLLLDLHQLTRRTILKCFLFLFSLFAFFLFFCLLFVCISCWRRDVRWHDSRIQDVADLTSDGTVSHA